MDFVSPSSHPPFLNIEKDEERNGMKRAVEEGNRLKYKNESKLNEETNEKFHHKGGSLIFHIEMREKRAFG